MRILITGACGFVGSALAESLAARRPGLEMLGFDNLMRPGSELNRARMASLGVALVHGDLRAASDFAELPPADWVIDAAANPSVLAGLKRGFSSRQLFEHNLAALVNVLEYAKQHRAGVILVSSSRVYSIAALRALPLGAGQNAFELEEAAAFPPGASPRGIAEEFSTDAPVSLYGSMKLAAETVALEYGAAFDFPVWVNRCGVLTGAGQFGTPEQGIFAYWINAHLRRHNLRYTGFGGSGKQVRDAFHPADLAALILAQMETARPNGRRIYNAGGGALSAISLAQLTGWCDARFGPHAPERDGVDRPYDTPWLVMDAARAQRDFGWKVEISLHKLLEEIARHAELNPQWLDRSGIGP